MLIHIITCYSMLIHFNPSYSMLLHYQDFQMAKLHSHRAQVRGGVTIDNFFLLSRLIMACRFHFLNNIFFDFFCRRHPHSEHFICFLCVFSTDEPCKDRLILTAILLSNIHKSKNRSFFERFQGPPWPPWSLSKVVIG